MNQQIMQHESGLEIRVAEMPGFGTATAQIGVKYGAVHTRYRQNGNVFHVPNGTAHYLEHRLFENEDGSVDSQFAALGAASNAYTDFDKTVYFFRTARDFPQALSLLLDFVQKPHFTEASVERERGIIRQELADALDDAESALFFLLLGGLYRRHPVRYDILGTAESIGQITAAHLRQVWEAFYHPQNMVLCCAGDLHAEDVLKTVDRMLLPRPFVPAEPLFDDEPETVAAAYKCKKMPVGKTQFAIGFKCVPVARAQRERALLLGALVFELIAGSASPLIRRLLAEGILHDALTADSLAADGWFTLFAEGESDDPQAVLDALLCEIETAKRKGLDETRFETLRRCAFGDLLISRNNPPAMAEAMLHAHLCGAASPEQPMQLLPKLTVSDAEAFLAEYFRSDRVCLAVIEPE